MSKENNGNLSNNENERSYETIAPIFIFADAEICGGEILYLKDKSFDKNI